MLENLHRRHLNLGFGQFWGLLRFSVVFVLDATVSARQTLSAVGGLDFSSRGMVGGRVA